MRATRGGGGACRVQSSASGTSASAAPARRRLSPISRGCSATTASGRRFSRAATGVAARRTASERIGRALGVETAFCVARTLGVPRAVAGGDSVVIPAGSRVFAVTGIARPDRFFSDVTAGGWELVGSIAFRDHHQFTRRDIARVAAAARSAAASLVLTTEKDAVRLEACDLGDLPIALVPLTVAIEPPAACREWLLQ